MEEIIISKQVLAFDLGASGGRAMLGRFDGQKIKIKEVHRFQNNPVTVNGNVYWDVLRLVYEIKQGLVNANIEGGFESVGIDTWGVDYCLIDKQGSLISNPHHYRDTRTNGILKKAFRFVTPENLYHTTGNQIMQINTAFQLMAEADNSPYILDNSASILLMPDYFNFMLSGVYAVERSIASTTQLYDCGTGRWADAIISALSINRNLFPEIRESGTVLGNISEEICTELSIPTAKVISVCEHDTQSAAAAVPYLDDGDCIFISCGSWSLFGTELSKPLVNEKSSSLNITNESGFGNTSTFLKNITGLWLIQETKRHYAFEGIIYSYSQLEDEARKSEPFRCFIDVDDPIFTPQGDMPSRIREYCARTNQLPPRDIGEVMRCIYESLALKYRQSLEELRECTGKEFERIHMVGGGTKDTFISQMTANACGLPVIAGPVEATVYGNVAVQLIAQGEISDIKEARKIISESCELLTYSPNENWDEAFERYINIIK